MEAVKGVFETVSPFYLFIDSWFIVGANHSNTTFAYVLGISRCKTCAQGPLTNISFCFHKGFISEALQPQFRSSMHLLFCCCYTCCGIVFLCQASISLSLHPDGLACCAEPLLRYVSLLMSWVGKQCRTNAVKCQKCQDLSPLNSYAPPTKFLNMNYQ